MTVEIVAMHGKQNKRNSFKSNFISIELFIFKKLKWQLESERFLFEFLEMATSLNGFMNYKEFSCILAVFWEKRNRTCLISALTS